MTYNHPSHTTTAPTVDPGNTLGHDHEQGRSLDSRDGGDASGSARGHSRLGQVCVRASHGCHAASVCFMLLCEDVKRTFCFVVRHSVGFRTGSGYIQSCMGMQLKMQLRIEVGDP